jgi:hypothetical protein
MKNKLWVFLSPCWLACGGLVDLGTVVEPPQGSAGMDAGSAGSGQGPDESFTHELVQLAGWKSGVCGLFSDQRVRCWTSAHFDAREVPGLRGIAFAGDPFNAPSLGRICVVEPSGTIACRNSSDCFYEPECWFTGEITEIVGVESAVSIWMSECQGLALRSDGLLQQWMGSPRPCSGDALPPKAATVDGFQVFGVPEGFDERIAAIPTSGSFGFVTESGRAFHTRYRPWSPALGAADATQYDEASWPPTVVGTFDDASMDDAVAIASSYEATAILRRSGKIWAFGAQRALGIGSTDGAYGAGEVVGIDDAVAIAGGYGTCAIRSDQSLWCWGPSSYGEHGVLGPGDQYASYRYNLYLPTKVQGIEGARAVSIVPGLTCVARGTNEVLCLGFDWSFSSPQRVTFH